jgi:hypothetical protein
MTGGAAFVAALAAGAALAGAVSAAPRADVQQPTCPAVLVRHEPNPALGTLSGGRWVAMSPRSLGIIGYLFGGEEVDGRFAVYAGGRHPVTGANEKVLWIVPRRLRGFPVKLVGRRLRVDARTGAVRTARGAFSRTLNESASPQTPGRLFPSTIVARTPGCWRLTLQVGRVSARAIVLVQPVPSP